LDIKARLSAWRADSIAKVVELQGHFELGFFQQRNTV
jgi:hypothetical protein